MSSSGIGSAGGAPRGSDFMQTGYRFQQSIIDDWKKMKGTLGGKNLIETDPGKVQEAFKLCLERALNSRDPNVKSAFLSQLKLAEQEVDFEGYKVKQIVAKPSESGGSNWAKAGVVVASICTLGAAYIGSDKLKAAWHGTERAPLIATLDGKALEKVPVTYSRHVESLPYQTSPPTATAPSSSDQSEYSPKSLRSRVEWARANNLLMEMPGKGAYVLDTENSCFIVVPPGSDDGYDYSKISLKFVSDKKTGGKVDSNTLAVIVEAYMDNREKIEQKLAAGGGEYDIRIDHDFSGDLLLYLVPRSSRVLDMNGHRQSGIEVAVSSESQTNHKKRKENGPIAKPKEKRDTHYWIPFGAHADPTKIGLVEKTQVPGWTPSTSFPHPFHPLRVTPTPPAAAAASAFPGSGSSSGLPPLILPPATHTPSLASLMPGSMSGPMFSPPLASSSASATPPGPGVAFATAADPGSSVMGLPSGASAATSFSAASSSSGAGGPLGLGGTPFHAAVPFTPEPPPIPTSTVAVSSTTSAGPGPALSFTPDPAASASSSGVSDSHVFGYGLGLPPASASSSASV